MHHFQVTEKTDIVDTFMAEEKSKCNWLDRLFNNYPVFYFAKDIKTNFTQNGIDQKFIAKPSKIKRLLGLLFVCFGFYGILCISLVIIQKILLPISITFLLFITFWTGTFIWTFFLNPKLSYKIIIDKERIILGKQAFEWSKVSEYLLMAKGGGRYQVTKLVLFIEKKQVMVYNLDNLNKSGAEIIKRIELYKN